MHTPLEELRGLLHDLELRVARLEEQSPANALAILPMMDDAIRRLDNLREAGSSVNSEATLLETVQAQLHKNRKLFLARIGGASALAEARAARQSPPPPEHWWWFVDQSLAAERRRTLRKLAVTGGVLLVVLLALGWAYQRFWAPDPDLQAAVGWQTRAENALIAGDYAAALDAASRSLERRPEQPALYLLRGVAREMLDQPTGAEQDFTTAWDLYPARNKDAFYSERAGYYLMVGQGEQALSDAQEAIALNPDSAIAYLRMAQAYELLGEREQAIAAYQQSAAAAQRTGDPQIEVIAKMGLAQLLQSPGATQQPLETP